MSTTQTTEADTGVSLKPLAVNAAGLGRLLGYCRSQIHAMNSAGQIPRPVRPTGHDPRWSVAEIERWLDAGCPTREQWEARKAATH
jgi:predicted DNA-binding transcriptional regulator AlpA